MLGVSSLTVSFLDSLGKTLALILIVLVMFLLYGIGTALLLTMGLGFGDSSSTCRTNSRLGGERMTICYDDGMSVIILPLDDHGRLSLDLLDSFGLARCDITATAGRGVHGDDNVETVSLPDGFESCFDGPGFCPGLLSQWADVELRLLR